MWALNVALAPPIWVEKAAAAAFPHWSPVSVLASLSACVLVARLARPRLGFVVLTAFSRCCCPGEILELARPNE